MNSYLLHHRVLANAQRCPADEAVRDGKRSISYGELDATSGSAAWALRRAGHRPRDVVGVIIPKSLEAVEVFLAVLRAGGCYVPLDPVVMPPERIRRILRLGEISCVVCSRRHWEELAREATAEELAQLRAMRVVFLEEVSAQRGTCVAARTGELDAGITDEDLAYILYTSGSTGVPKGVTISHRNALTFVNWAIDYFDPAPGITFACHAPLQFDLSVFDLYVALSTGGRVALVPHELAANPKSLLEWIGQNEIEYWYSVPSVWMAILNYARIENARLGRLKKILFAGEVFPPRYLGKLMEQVPWASFYNMYGPTETNVCTVHRVLPEDCRTGGPIPIGAACANTEVVALDPERGVVAPGGVGELMVKGSIVTRGYYRDPERTQAAFLRSPLPHHAGALLYKTGDIVRVRPDGSFEYLGRSDFMVKIAGFRVELQEVERALQSIDGVGEAVAVAYEDEGRGTNSLGALVRMDEGRAPKTLEIRSAIARALPKYMLPEVIIGVAELPRTSNGKIDRNGAKQLLLHELE